jgi:NAD(P)-dependent dehydrogenase (short-subunit alcohol dehydrogenase family)
MGIMNGKVVVVTGASSGIGRATAVALAAEGARVVAAARRETKGRELVDEIKAGGGEATWVTTDLLNERDVEAMIQCAVDTYGRLDGAFNNAGTSVLAPLAQATNINYDMIVNLNQRGTFWCMQHEIRAMQKTGGGAIVNCSSLAALRALPGASIYAATKAAVLAMTRCAAVEYAQMGIRVNAVNPGVIETELASEVLGLQDPARRAFLEAFHPVNRVGTPEEVAALVVFLLSDRASFITGQDISVDGGCSVAVNPAPQRPR